MFINCPKCEEEIDVTITSYGTSGSYFEPPEPAEYDFAEEHPCQESWTDEQMQSFDNKVWEFLADPAYNEPDYF